MVVEPKHVSARSNPGSSGRVLERQCPLTRKATETRRTSQGNWDGRRRGGGDEPRRGEDGGKESTVAVSVDGEDGEQEAQRR